MNRNYLLHGATTSLFVAGMVFLWMGSSEVLEGSPATDQGSTVVTGKYIEQAVPVSEVVRGAPSDALLSYGSTELLIGMLLIFVGFFLHAILVSRKAPLHLPMSKKKRKKNTETYYEWFHMELR